jgi:hypothetical protein
MNTNELRENIHQFIDVADERTLRLINAIVEAESNIDAPNIPQWFYEELDKRHDRHLKGESKSLSWQEVKERILKS